MLANRKPKPPLLNAIFLVNDAAVIAYEYLRDKDYMPREEELRVLDAIVDALLRNHATVWHIARNLRRRARGEPEETQEFIETKVFDYQ